jgi:hypothetical protein
MAKFSIYSDGVFIGLSELEKGDAPMGVAFGVFQPEAGYESVRDMCKVESVDQSQLNLSVLSPDGIPVPCEGIGVHEFQLESGEPEIEIEILGVPYPLYAELFPQHLAAYEKQFN